MPNYRQSRKVVYVLGAGFSLGTGHSVTRGMQTIKMPTQFTLFEELCTLYYRRTDELNAVAKLIRRYFHPDNYRATREKGHLRHQDLFNFSLEEIITFFDEVLRHNALPKDQMKEIQEGSDQLQCLIVELISFLSSNGDPGRNRNLRDFADRILQTDCIVTFNWDTLLDRVLANRNKDWQLHWGYGATVRRCLPIQTPFRGEKPRRYPKLLKLHGSINWIAHAGVGATPEAYVSGTWGPDGRNEDVVMMPPKMIKEEIWAEQPSGTQPVVRRGNEAVGSDFYRALWAEAEEQIAGAKRVVFIGYSFPPADFAFRNLLRRANFLRDKLASPEIDIVDPNVARLAQIFKDSFKIEVPIENQYLSLRSFLDTDRPS